jgi:hypothetical protein
MHAHMRSAYALAHRERQSRIQTENRAEHIKLARLAPDGGEGAALHKSEASLSRAKLIRPVSPHFRQPSTEILFAPQACGLQMVDAQPAEDRYQQRPGVVDRFYTIASTLPAWYMKEAVNEVRYGL